jgi:hypothetical protein
MRGLYFTSKPNHVMKRGVHDMEIAGWDEVIQDIGNYIGLLKPTLLA